MQLSHFLLALLLLSEVCFAQRSADAKATNVPTDAAPSAQAATPPSPAPNRMTPSVTPLTMEQIRANLPATAAERFEFLRNQRKVTLEAIGNATNAIAAIDSKISTLRAAAENDRESERTYSIPRVKEDLARAKDDEAQAQKHLDALRSSKASAGAIEKAEMELSSRKSFVSTVQGVLTDSEAKEKIRAERDKDLTSLNGEREGLSALQLSHQRLLGSIDDMVNQLFIASDATNSFKLRMSIAFSALVGVVIVGFFSIAWSNEDIKKTIFANEAGIQFITVFSIVIAVILFGIIGVLESKELSALLGGLSGYILGKSRAA